MAGQVLRHSAGDVLTARDRAEIRLTVTGMFRVWKNRPAHDVEGLAGRFAALLRDKAPMAHPAIEREKLRYLAELVEQEILRVKQDSGSPYRA